MAATVVMMHGQKPLRNPARFSARCQQQGTSQPWRLSQKIGQKNTANLRNDWRYFPGLSVVTYQAVTNRPMLSN